MRSHYCVQFGDKAKVTKITLKSTGMVYAKNNRPTLAPSLVSINKVCYSGSCPRLWIVGCQKFKLVPNRQGKGTFVWCKQFLCFVPLAGFSCFGDSHVVLLYCQPLCFLNCCGVWQSLLRRRVISDCRLERSWGNCYQPFHFLNVTRWTVALQLLPWKCLQNDECFMFSFCEKWSPFLKVCPHMPASTY